jgi:hypothetical protein
MEILGQISGANLEKFHLLMIIFGFVGDLCIHVALKSGSTVALLRPVWSQIAHKLWPTIDYFWSSNFLVQCIMPKFSIFPL